MQVYLIGFMGAGKTTYGNAAARKAKWHFYDLDELIESHATLSIPNIFAQKGETYFRQLEREILLQTTDLPAQPALIACGGGTPCFHNNMQWMNGQGTTVYLRLPEDILIGRLRSMRAHRLILNQTADADLGTYVRQLLQRREMYYMQAHYILTEVSRIEKDLSELLVNIDHKIN